MREVRADGGGRWGVLGRALLGAALLLLLLAPSGCSRLGGDGGSGASLPLTPTGPAGRLQEVAPPPAVQQLRRALEERRPQLRITSPANGSALPAGSWTLQISGQDWPLRDAGALGPGAHLAVQVDDGLPRRLPGQASAEGGFELRVPMAPLTPGSHRVTVTALRPWGEVVKSPGASAQIRLHRVAVNPLALPAPGTPQLFVASPGEAAGPEPVLLDWLLRDAPLQGLREGDARWRLRVTVNGDSFLVDQNAPLWLKGWRRGSNSLLLELVDERGEPLNPPFNSLVREVMVDSSGPLPRWRGGTLSERELATLLGSGTAEPEDEAEPEEEAEPEGEAEQNDEPSEPEVVPEAMLETVPEVKPPAAPAEAPLPQEAPAKPAPQPSSEAGEEPAPELPAEIAPEPAE